MIWPTRKPKPKPVCTRDCQWEKIERVKTTWDGGWMDLFDIMQCKTCGDRKHVTYLRNGNVVK